MGPSSGLLRDYKPSDAIRMQLFEAIHGSRVTRVLVQEFLDDVAAVGLQQQYEAVTENLGLIAQLIQCEHAAADADTGLR